MHMSHLELGAWCTEPLTYRTLKKSTTSAIARELQSRNHSRETAPICHEKGHQSACLCGIESVRQTINRELRERLDIDLTYVLTSNMAVGCGLKERYKGELYQ